VDAIITQQIAQRQHKVAHALRVCDTVAQCFEVGKCTIIKVFKSGIELNKMDVLSEDIVDIIKEVTVFMTACYGVKSQAKMSIFEVHGKVWSRGIGRKTGTKAPELRSLQSSREAFKENVKRANIQTAVWKSAALELNLQL
jgi:hypothetical protein